MQIYDMLSALVMTEHFFKVLKVLKQLGGTMEMAEGIRTVRGWSSL
jgi:hypothetical protein